MYRPVAVLFGHLIELDAIAVLWPGLGGFQDVPFMLNDRSLLLINTFIIGRQVALLLSGVMIADQLCFSCQWLCGLVLQVNGGSTAPCSIET